MSTVYDEDEISKYLGIQKPMLVRDALMDQYISDDTAVDPAIYLPLNSELPNASGKSPAYDPLYDPMAGTLHKNKLKNSDDWYFEPLKNMTKPTVRDTFKTDLYSDFPRLGMPSNKPMPTPEAKYGPAPLDAQTAGSNAGADNGLPGGVDGGTGREPFSAAGNIGATNSQGNTRNPLAEAAGRRMGKMGTADGDPNASQQGRKDYMQPPAQLPQPARTPMLQGKEGTQAGDPNAIQMGDQAPVIAEEEQPQTGMERPQAAIWPDWLKQEQPPEAETETDVATNFSNMFPSIDPSSGAGAALLGLLAGVDETGARSAAAFGGWSPDSGVAIARQPLTTAANINSVNKDRYTQKLDIAKLDASARAAELKAIKDARSTGKSSKYSKMGEDGLVHIYEVQPDGSEIDKGLDPRNAPILAQERARTYEAEAGQKEKQREQAKLRVDYRGKSAYAPTQEIAGKLREANIAVDFSRELVTDVKQLIEQDPMTDGKLSTKTVDAVKNAIPAFVGNLAAFRELGVLQAGDLQYLGKELGMTDPDVNAAITNPADLIRQIVRRAEVSENPDNILREMENVLAKMDYKRAVKFKQYAMEKDAVAPGMQGETVAGSEIEVPKFKSIPLKPTAQDNTQIYTELANTTGLAVQVIADMAKNIIPRAPGETDDTYIERLKTWFGEKKDWLLSLGIGKTPEAATIKPRATATPKPKPTAAPAVQPTQKPQPTPTGKRKTLADALRGQ